MENKFTDNQNEVFAGLFGALKNSGASFNVAAHTIIDMDDANFTNIFTDTNCTLSGTAGELISVNERAKHLGLK